MLLQRFAIITMSHVEQDFAGQIREQGYRYTPQRQLILDTLCALGRHATVDEIYERVKETTSAMNLATVYRTVNFLTDLRLLYSAVINGETVYEIARPTPHHHLVCRKCGKVTTVANRHFQELADHLQDEHHFTAEIAHLTIKGICAQCQEPDVPEEDAAGTPE